MMEYNFNGKDIKNVKEAKDVMHLLINHSFESFVFSVRTGEFNYALAKELGYSDKEAEMYFLCGLYHDVGKIGMSKFLIDYPGRYDDAMRAEMKKHTQGGGDLLEHAKADKMLSETAKYHHCNYDGSGYLEIMKGDDIPFHARLTRVSDSADAYLSTRSYKEGYDVRGLYQDLEKYKNSWYDPKIIDALKRVHEKVLQIFEEKTEELDQDSYMYYMKKIYGVDKISAEYLFDLIRNA